VRGIITEAGERFLSLGEAAKELPIKVGEIKVNKFTFQYSIGG